MDKISRLYFKSCKELQLNPVKAPEIKGFYFTLGNRNYLFRNAATPFNNVAAATLAANKYSTNLFLKNHGLPVTNAIAITRKEFKNGLLDISELRFPVVIKPCWDSSLGRGVICNIQTSEKLIELLTKYLKKHKSICIEEFATNMRSYRVLVSEGKVIGVVERIPAHVIGDGEHTIEELIVLENQHREILKKKLPFGPLKVNEETDYLFEERGLGTQSIPAINEKIPIRYICNASAGGTTIGLTLKDICKENVELAVKAAKVLDLNLVGFDFLCEDIAKPILQTKGFIIEANYAPDITLHEQTPLGVKTRVTLIIMKHFVRKNLISYLHYKYRTKYLGIAVKALLVFGFIFLIANANTLFH